MPCQRATGHKDGMLEQLQRFWEIVADVWRLGFGGISVGEVLLALLLVMGFATLRGLFTRFVLGALERVTARTRTEIDDFLREAVEEPLKFLFIALGFFFAVEVLPFKGLAAEIADNLLRSVVAFGIFWTFYAAVDPMRDGLGQLRLTLSQEILGWLFAVFKIAIALIGAATILQIWGIQIAPIIAGFGLFGVAVALGAQDLFKNLLAGMSILLEKRFRIGDWISVDGVVEGVVEHIGFRSTRLKRFDDAPVTVPNNLFADHAVINFSAMSYRRIYWLIGLEYGTTTAQLRVIRDDIASWLRAHSDFVDPPERPCFIFVDSFNASSIDMIVYTFTRTKEWEPYLALKQELALAIKQIVEAQGAGFAFPSRTIYLARGGGEVPDLFEPEAETAE